MKFFFKAFFFWVADLLERLFEMRFSPWRNHRSDLQRPADER